MTLPEAFKERMKGFLNDEYDSFIASYDRPEIKGIRVNKLKGDEEKLMAAVSTALPSLRLERVDWCEEGFWYVPDLEAEAQNKRLRPGSNPLHEAGAFYMQEPSAMLPATLLDVEEGMKVLDLCASPGGKSTQIASKMNNTGFLMSNEINAARAKILSENIERMGIRNAYVTNEDSSRLAELFPAYFERIMVDAPCSGEGMFRKNDEAVNEWSPENVELCAARQDEILDNAYIMLSGNGKMVYSTCTFAVLENEGTIERFIKRHPDMEVLEQHRMWPHKVNGEGHFAAVLVKNSGLGMENSRPVYGVQQGIRKKDCREYVEFEEENLTEKPEGIFYLSKDQLYLLPYEAPSMKGIKVVRPGLHLGTVKKGRFEPAHALAMALTGNEVKNTTELKATDLSAYKFFNGETFNAEGNKGWQLITIDGYSAGWGKLAGGIMKNHYPKGLRRAL